jgi:NitT/TauT family transport system substrate-binding protein
MKRLTALATVLAVPVALSSPARGDSRNLRLVTMPVDGSVGMYYARELGLLKDAALDLDIQLNANGSAIAAAVAGNAVDIGWSNVISLAIAIKRGIPFTIVAGGGVYARGVPTSAVVVPNDSPLRTARDLVGKTIGVNGLRNMPQLSIQAWMDKNGADPSTPRFSEIPFPETAAALLQKRCDAAFLAEPFITAAKDKLRIFGAPLDLLGPRTMLGAYFTTSTWARANPELLAAFIGTLDRAHTWANAHPNESAAILAKYSGTDPAVARSMRRVVYVTKPEGAAMQGQIDIAARYGDLPATFNAADMIFTG